MTLCKRIAHFPLRCNLMIYRRLVQGLKRYVDQVNNPYPPTEKLLFSFATPSDIARWRAFSDAEYGGSSTAQLARCEDDKEAATFSGRYSTSIDGDNETLLQRSGFCGITSKAEEGVYCNLDDFNTLVLRVRGDGRKYIANLRTENWVVGQARNHDIYQAFLFARAGEWQDVEIPLSRFLLTWKGRVVDELVHMNRQRVTSVGLSLAGGSQLQPDGEFRLDIRWIKAASRPGYL